MNFTGNTFNEIIWNNSKIIFCSNDSSIKQEIYHLSLKFNINMFNKIKNISFYVTLKHVSNIVISIYATVDHWKCILKINRKFLYQKIYFQEHLQLVSVHCIRLGVVNLVGCPRKYYPAKADSRPRHGTLTILLQFTCIINVAWTFWI